MNLELARARSALYRKIRDFFDARGYLEVETPILSPALIPEPTIEDFATRYENEFAGSMELYMVPSPEVFMKRIIAEWRTSIYQISKCFRNAEQIGRIHNPEFTMLEYYSVGFDEKDSLAITEELFRAAALPSCPEGLKEPFQVVTMEEALRRATGVELQEIQPRSALVKKARELGLMMPEDLDESWADTFNRIFVAFVEPTLKGPRPVALTGYPVQIECLALNDGIVKRRWELYWNGMEIANCYAEETDRAQIEERFRKEYAVLARKRSASGTVIPDADWDFCSVFGPSYPRCSGVAMGLDRFLAAQCSLTSIEPLLLFPFFGTIRS